MIKEHSPHSLAHASHGALPHPAHHHPMGANRLQAAEEIRLSDLFAIILRNKILIACIVVFITSMAVLYTYLAKPRYTASAVVQIDVRGNKVVDIEAVVSSISSDDAAIKSELDVLSSRTLAGMVVDELKLKEDPEFNGQLAEVSVVRSFINVLREDYLSFLATTPEEKSAEALEGEDLVHASVINKFLNRLQVTRKERSYTILVEFTSESPKKAQAIANALVNTYLKHQLALKYEGNKRANEWLSDRLQELQKKLQESERRVQQFRVANNLTGEGRTMTEQQLAQLTSELVSARTARTQAEAKLKNIRDDVNSVPEVLSSNLIQSLRAQEVEVSRKKADLSNRYGPKHPKMINVNTEAEDLKAKIKAEIENIITSIENEAKLSRDKEEALEESLEAIQTGKADEASEKATVQLAELTRQMEADRALYESFLARFKETSEQGLEQADAKVVSFAEMPLSPSYPKKSLIIAGSFLFSLLLAVAIVFLIEEMDQTFRGSHQWEQATHLRMLGMVPQIKMPTDQKYGLEVMPSTMFFESLRTVLTSLYFSKPNNIPKSLLITSSVPGEGKTFLSLSFCNMMARSGMKVLLIDCDLKRAALSQYLNGGRHMGKQRILSDFITGKAGEMEIIHESQQPGLHYILSNSNTAYSQNILESERMKYLIQVMSLRYDYVVLDCPPVMAVSDALVLAPFVDAVIYAVRWGSTPKKIVMNAVQTLKHTGAFIAGGVLTQVHLGKHNRYNYGDTAYYYSEYKDYYTTRES